MGVKLNNIELSPGFKGTVNLGRASRLYASSSDGKEYTLYGTVFKQIDRDSVSVPSNRHSFQSDDNLEVYLRTESNRRLLLCQEYDRLKELKNSIQSGEYHFGISKTILDKFRVAVDNSVKPLPLALVGGKLSYDHLYATGKDSAPFESEWQNWSLTDSGTLRYGEVVGQQPEFKTVVEDIDNTVDAIIVQIPSEDMRSKLGDLFITARQGSHGCDLYAFEDDHTPAWVTGLFSEFDVYQVSAVVNDSNVLTVFCLHSTGLRVATVYLDRLLDPLNTEPTIVEQPVVLSGVDSFDPIQVDISCQLDEGDIRAIVVRTTIDSSSGSETETRYIYSGMIDTSIGEIALGNYYEDTNSPVSRENVSVINVGSSTLVVWHTADGIRYRNISYFSPEDDFEFDPSTRTITGYSGSGGAVNIPVTIDGVGVVYIGESAFEENDNIVSVEGPSIEYISDRAFHSCSALLSTYFRGVTVVGERAFNSCTSLISSFFPSAVTVEDYAFISCTSLTTTSFPVVENIGNYSFSYCKSVESAAFPMALNVGRSAFWNCTSLVSIKLPAVIDFGGEVGTEIFFGCGSLRSVYLGNAVPTSVDDHLYFSAPAELVTYVPEDSTKWNGVLLFPTTGDDRRSVLTYTSLELETTSITSIFDFAYIEYTDHDQGALPYESSSDPASIEIGEAWVPSEGTSDIPFTAFNNKLGGYTLKVSDRIVIRDPADSVLLIDPDSEPGEDLPDVYTVSEIDTDTFQVSRNGYTFVWAADTGFMIETVIPADTPKFDSGTSTEAIFSEHDIFDRIDRVHSLNTSLLLETYSRREGDQESPRYLVHVTWDQDTIGKIYTASIQLTEELGGDLWSNTSGFEVAGETQDCIYLWRGYTLYQFIKASNELLFAGQHTFTPGVTRTIQFAVLPSTGGVVRSSDTEVYSYPSLKAAQEFELTENKYGVYGYSDVQYRTETVPDPVAASELHPILRSISLDIEE